MLKFLLFFFSSRRRHTRLTCDWSSDVCSSDLSGCKAGLALNPATPLSYLDHVLHKLDLVLIMSVNPGFGGQQFIPHTLEKLRDARRKIDDTGRAIMLEVDGGVNAGNIAGIARAGADTFVAGSAIFGSKDYRATISQMRDALKSVD